MLSQTLKTAILGEDAHMTKNQQPELEEIKKEDEELDEEEEYGDIL